MRTKALICAAVLTAAAFASQAQVFSVNVVGYVTLSLTNGLNLINNPLDSDGTGLNNSLYTVFSSASVPNTTVASAFWVPTGAYSNSTFLTGTGKWSGPTNAVNAALAPGKGIFFKVPAAVLKTNITIVGNVLQGALTNTFPVAQQVLSSQVPQAGGIQTALGYAPASLDKVSQWNPNAQKFGSANNFVGGKWGLGEPNVAVGEAFFITTHAASKWTRNFTVQ